jgi:MFS family permease
MNTAGQVGGMLSPVIIGFVLQYWQNWSMPLYLTGVLFALGAVCWIFIDATRPIQWNDEVPTGAGAAAGGHGLAARTPR